MIIKHSEKLKVGVIDYGVGNLASVMKALNFLNIDAILVEKTSTINLTDSLILPGVGNFANCKKLLDIGGWTQSILEESLVKQKPLLGICLGMHLLGSKGYEGSENEKDITGLCLINGTVSSLKNSGCSARIPHVGWNSIVIKEPNSPIFNGIPDKTDFYFVHSYGFFPANTNNIVASVQYGGLLIPVAIQNRHIWGVQFHPEKSSKAGLRLLNNFYNYALNVKD